MMDYEWKIKQLEEEARHEKAMRELQGTRLDAHDRSIAAIHEILDRTERNIEALSVSQSQTSGMLKDLMAVQAETQKMLQVFIESLTRGGNGKH
jgi:polysaccharide pyruvyl transferase WcaK-like protein